MKHVSKLKHGSTGIPTTITYINDRWALSAPQFIHPAVVALVFTFLLLSALQLISTAIHLLAV